MQLQNSRAARHRPMKLQIPASSLACTPSARRNSPILPTPSEGTGHWLRGTSRAIAACTAGKATPVRLLASRSLLMAWNLEGSLKACRRLRSDILTPKFAARALHTKMQTRLTIKIFRFFKREQGLGFRLPRLHCTVFEASYSCRGEVETLQKMHSRL